MISQNWFYGIGNELKWYLDALAAHQSEEYRQKIVHLFGTVLDEYERQIKTGASLGFAPSSAAHKKIDTRPDWFQHKKAELNEVLNAHAAGYSEAGRQNIDNLFRAVLDEYKRQIETGSSAGSAMTRPNRTADP